MADERVILQADLNAIANNLSAIHGDLQTIDNGVGTVNENVKVVYDEIGALAQEFRAFVDQQTRANRLSQAEIRLVKIRQELEKKYGHYDIVRRTTTGILQADDLGVVKKDTISTATEELMISTPGYWLAPCLVALAAWINDQPELAEKAVKEAIKRDDEKSSLFFSLVLRRANRKNTCLQWVQRYLENQDEENLNRATVIVLDAYASGLFGADSEGVVSKQMTSWLEHLEEKPGFIEQQTQQWSDAINMKRKPIDSSQYTYLKKYSKTWPVLEYILTGANLHAEMLAYLISVFEQKISTATVKEQLDEILNNLVTGFDNEELPLRKEEQFEQFVVDFMGDEARARQNMTLEQTAFEETKDFTQLLTDAAMKPEATHSSVSTQKFAFALSRDWVMTAYNDIVANNRAQIPDVITINIEDFNDETRDGENEGELINRFEKQQKKAEQAELATCKLNAFENYFCLYGGAAFIVIGLLMLAFGNKFLGLVVTIGGIGFLINHFSKKKSMEANRKLIVDKYKSKVEKGRQIIRATLAEVVDFRMEFSEKDSESQKVIDYLEGISPDHYVKQVSDSARRMKL